jgi:transcriptional regulator with XRE-family HTH domain
MSAPTVRRRRLGAELRRFRKESGLTLDEASERTGFTAPKLSRIETARIAAKAPDVERILDAYAVEDPALRSALVTLAKEGGRRGWWQSYKNVLSQSYEDFISLEAEASSIRSFQLAMVPGLLQTSAYAREVIGNTAMTDAVKDKVNALVEVRIARQGVLIGREQPLDLWAIIHEPALTARCQSPATMRDQLQRLLDLSEQPNVSIQILPSTAASHPGAMGSFTMLGFPEHPDLDVVHIESLTNALYVEDRDQVRTYGQAFERLRASALPCEESLAYIARLKDNLT